MTYLGDQRTAKKEVSLAQSSKGHLRICTSGNFWAELHATHFRGSATTLELHHAITRTGNFGRRFFLEQKNSVCRWAEKLSTAISALCGIS